MTIGFRGNVAKPLMILSSAVQFSDGDSKTVEQSNDNG